MSVFDTAMACTRNMHECLLQNHFETPPYGPIPDAEGKLRLAVNGMIDALVIAMDAESRGVVMPPLAVVPAGQTQTQTMEHDLHREYAVSLAALPPPAPPEAASRENTIL
jgi:hypothetical protein